ncbi:nicotinamide mononucleotide deamidase-related protein, partial [Candidatus Bathyarchaeota archaeon]|nr:nicotinamide mononucleotide deamidase-related protein [Candidatus Bathyarchaeota archaeon]
LDVKLEIICVGNELLTGKILNTNAQWLAKRATSLGAMVKRITVVGDDVDEIASAVCEALQRKSNFIIITGGLGPTFDDKTLEGVAKALNRSLVLNEEALQMVKAKYAEAGELELTSPRTKMAMLPEGATPLPNPRGVAPGVILKLGDVSVVALPGVPAEMEAVFEASVAELIRNASEGAAFYEASIYVEDLMESNLAPIIEAVMHDNPYVYIKSHPKGNIKNPRIEINISTVAKSSLTAKNRIGKVIIQLSELIREKGGKVKV